MCGIAGFVGQGSRENLEQMISAIRYRGPDDKGIFFRDGVGLAHARLSIIDLSPAGHQPMSNSKGTTQIIFNGEIYNFQELRRELEQRGYAFRGDSDTEVIVHLYDEMGEKAFERLNGMFAIALYDFRERKLILARDRLGKKPLYWGFFGSTLIFGSELKALTAHPLFRKSLNLKALNKYLVYEYVPTPHTIFENAHKLEPATYLVWQDGRARKGIFWEIYPTPHHPSLREAIAAVDKLVSDSVRRRLVSDVPLGVFLSGGVDSSAVAYYAQRNSRTRIKTFSIGFGEKSFDEARFARKVAQYLGAEHHEKTLTANDALGVIPEIIQLVDEPLADASIIPTYLVSKFARESVTTVLGGDGGDELFGGYPTFQAQKLAKIYEGLPPLIRRLAAGAVFRIPASESDFSLGFKLKKFIAGFSGPSRYRHQLWLGSFGRDEREKLFNPHVWKDLEQDNEFDDIDRYLAEVPGGDLDNRLLYVYLRTYLMDGVLVKVDRASMFNSLEVRAPLLDYRLVEFVENLPYNFKVRGLTTKYIFKKMMTDKLPRDIVFRPKKGFGVPLARWLKKELRGFCEQALSAERTVDLGLFSHDYISRLKLDHFSGKKDNRQQLWTLIVLYEWHRRFS